MCLLMFHVVGLHFFEYCMFNLESACEPVQVYPFLQEMSVEINKMKNITYLMELERKVIELCGKKETQLGNAKFCLYNSTDVRTPRPTEN
ncbi:hypothetical protein TNCT_607921 [Trichonephila clavata]|uniref:Uncharacterized protein n=1 Tax=Trichonephila clavata TaxID=2740835 RepID=A0A8X6G043_TRICU|nr:hypothetical protein TNCT_607921 [Trichonephila clavata]